MNLIIISILTIISILIIIFCVANYGSKIRNREVTMVKSITDKIIHERAKRAINKPVKPEVPIEPEDKDYK